MSDPDSTNWLIQLFVTYRPVVDFFQALLAPVIAITVVYIAYAQYKTNKQRLRLEQYDRRVETYTAVRDFLNRIASKSKVEQQLQKEFHAAQSKSHFLFDHDIVNYMRKLQLRAIELSITLDEISDSTLKEEERKEAKNRKAEILQYFRDQQLIARKKFMKYLQLT